MHFLVDEDLPRSTDNLLGQYGHKAIDVRDTGLRGASDAVIASYARKQELCLLSATWALLTFVIILPESIPG